MGTATDVRTRTWADDVWQGRWQTFYLITYFTVCINYSDAQVSSVNTVICLN